MSALKPFLTNIANAIREKKKTTEPIPAQSFANEILSIEGGGKKPTLNAPFISLNNSVLTVTDYRNGIFTEEYGLFVNGEQKSTFIEKKILLEDYGVTYFDEIEVEAVSNYFNSSKKSNMVKIETFTKGTDGLEYIGDCIVSIGTAVGKNIIVGGEVNGKNIVAIGYSGYQTFWNLEGYTIYFNNAKSFIFGSCQNCTNTTFIFAVGSPVFRDGAFNGCKNCIFDFTRAEAVPVEIPPLNDTDIVVVKDSLYDEWILGTNWARWANITVKLSDWIAQGGVA